MNPASLSAALQQKLLTSKGVSASSRASTTRLQFGSQADKVEKNRNTSSGQRGYSLDKKLKAAWIAGKQHYLNKKWLILSTTCNVFVTTLLSLVPPHIHGPLFFFPLMAGIDFIFRAGEGASHGWSHPEQYLNPERGEEELKNCVSSG